MTEQAIVNGLTDGAAYSLIAIGLVLAYRVSGIVNLAQGEYAVLAILVVGSLHTAIGMVGAVLLTLMAVGVLGAVTERVALRRVAGAPPISGLLLTTGVAFAMSGAMRLGWGPDEFTLDPLSGTESFDVLGALVQPQSVWLVGSTLVLTIAVALTLSRTFIGKTAVACAIEPTGARLSGIRIDRFRLGTFALTAVLGALAGILGGSITFVTFESGFSLTQRGLIAAALGGMSSVSRAALGGVVLGLCEAFATTFISSQLKTPIAFLVLLAVLVLRPSGFASVRAEARAP